MTYIEEINKRLKPQIDKSLPLVIDLFAGAGGLALGFEAQGFQTVGYEMDEDCCNTYRLNLHGECRKEFITADTVFPDADVIIGGPPCQPFSVGGKQEGHNDARNGFPAFIAAVEKVKPKIWMFENVRGLLYKNKWYLDEVLAKLEGLGYKIRFQLFNTSYYEVPQTRQRIVAVGYREDGYSFPAPVMRKVTAGNALGELTDEVPELTRVITASMDTYIAKYEKASKCVTPRDLHMHLPARTLTCRNLAGATGDMHRIKLADGRRRTLTPREAARLQSFPDWFQFTGSVSSQFQQIGNAVPPMFAHHIAKSFREYLQK